VKGPGATYGTDKQDPSFRDKDEISTWQMRDWFQKDPGFLAPRSEAESTGRRWRELVLAESSPGLAASLERVLNGERFVEKRPI
jgi:hypothetical protein